MSKDLTESKVDASSAADLQRKCDDLQEKAERLQKEVQRLVSQLKL
jgi:hypothetical protein